MKRQPPRSTRTNPLLPDTTLCRSLELRKEAGGRGDEHERSGVVALEDGVADVVPLLLERGAVDGHRPVAHAVAGVPLDALLVELLALVGGELVTVEPVGDLLGHELEGGVGPPERLRVERVVLVAVAVVVALDRPVDVAHVARSEEHTSELQSLMRISYAVFCLK